MTYEYIEPTWDGVIRGQDVYNTLAPRHVTVLEFGTCQRCDALCSRLTPGPWRHELGEASEDHEPVMYLIPEEPG